MMTSFKKTDDFFMSFLTTLRYPKRFKTPFSKFLFAVGFNLFILSLFISPDLLDGRIRGLTYILVPIYLLAIFYHWRRWKRQEKENNH
jgi:hypothetical protein